MKKSRYLLIALLSMILAVVLTTAAFAEDHGAVVDSGQCGDNLTWTLYEDGLLEISGTGEMWDYEWDTLDSYRNMPPWYELWYESPRSRLKLKLNEGITKIGNYAFGRCGGFTGSLTIPDSVTTIGDYAFYDCSGLTGSLVIPNSVTSIVVGAFSFCYGFTGNLVIPNSVTTIGNSAFYDCSGLTGSLVIPNSVTSIGVGAFSFCYGFTGNLVIPNSVTTIGSYAFESCGFTGSLTIPDGVTTIGNYAFYGCGGFASASFYGDAPSSFGSNVFKDCASDFTIYYLEGKSGWTTPEWNGYPCYPIDSIPDNEKTYLSVLSENTSKRYTVGDEITLYVSNMTESETGTVASYPDGIAVVADSNIMQLVYHSSDTKYEKFVYRFVEEGFVSLQFQDNAFPEPVSIMFEARKNPYITVYADEMPIYHEYEGTWYSFLGNDYNLYTNGLYVADFKEPIRVSGGYQFEFSVFNNTYAPGTVEIYNADGQLIDFVILKKFEEMTSFKTTIDQSVNVLVDVVKFDGLSFKSDTAGKETKIKITVPDGGYMIITNSILNSDVCFYVNLIDYLLTTMKMIDTTLKFDPTVQDEITFTVAFESLLKYNGDFSNHKILQDYAKKFVKKIAQTELTRDLPFVLYEATVESTSGLFDYFDIDLAKIMFDILKDYSLGSLQKAFEKSTANIGAALRSSYYIIKIGNYTNQSICLCKNAMCRTALQILPPEPVVPEPVVMKKELTGGYQVKAISESEFESETVLQVFKVFIVPDQTVVAINKMTVRPVYEKDCIIYNISLQKDGLEKQPKEPIKVQIPIDPKYSSVLVYRQNDDGTLDNMNATIRNGVIEFTAEHFCDFIIITEEEGSSATIGDINADGAVDATDRMILARFLAGWEGYEEKIKSKEAADIDGDGDITAKDRMILARKLAGWEGYDQYFTISDK